MDKTKIVCGISSFLIGATGSTMFLIGKIKGEKKVKKDISEKINDEITHHQFKEYVAKDMIDFEQRYIDVENKIEKEEELKPVVTFKELCETEKEKWERELEEAQRSQKVLKEIINQ